MIRQYNNSDEFHDLEVAENRSRTAGNVPPNMIYDTDPVFEPFQHSVLFYENNDGTATAAYLDNNKNDVRMKTKIKVYSDILQSLPDHQ